VCLSWYAYSQDLAFQESYEIMVSTTGGTAADLAAGDTIFSEDAEQKDFTFRSVDLSAYAGQDVWIGFHHSSVDKFLLVVDDIRLAEVEQIDLSMFLLDPISAPKNTDITISGALINRGLTEIEFDSAELQISYRIDNGEVKTYGFPSDETIAPNDTLQFSHDSTWTPTDDAVYLIEFWIDSLAGDGNVENDTLKKWQGIGAKTAVTERMIPGLSVWYNQAGSSIMLNELPGVGYTWELRDIQGRILSPTQGLATTHMQVPSLKPGIYFWVLSGQAGIEHVQKISILR
ncbi:MAG: choice-of-anchor J domain-containing protein, partial [Bacteroidota bacterium]